MPMPQSNIDWTRYMEGLQGKTNVDVDNLTEVGKNNINHLSVPSDKYIDLPLQSNIMPADGYCALSKRANGVNQYLGLGVKNGIGMQVVSHRNDDGYVLTIPVKKGDKVNVNNNFGGTFYYYRFIYAEGSLPKVE